MTRKAGPDRWLEDSSKPRTRIQAFRERFELIEQRVLNNRIFAKKSFYVDDDASARPELTRVSGVRRAEGTVCILGLLTQPQEGQFFLEDLSGRVEVDITAAEASVGLYTENCIIIVEGVMKGEVLVANCLAMPPSEDREKTCARFPALAAPDDRKPYTQEEWERLRREEEQQVDANVVVLSDVWLDRPRVISGLKKLFGRYDIECQKRAEEGSDISLFFVLMGNFLSHSSAHGVAAHREGFDKLATLLESFQVGCAVPGRPFPVHGLRSSARVFISIQSLLQRGYRCQSGVYGERCTVYGLVLSLSSLVVQCELERSCQVMNVHV